MNSLSKERIMSELISSCTFPNPVSLSLPLAVSSLYQGCPNSVLEGHCPAEEFSSKLPHTYLKVSRMPSKTMISWFRSV